MEFNGDECGLIGDEWPGIPVISMNRSHPIDIECISSHRNHQFFLLIAMALTVQFAIEHGPVEIVHDRW